MAQIMAHLKSMSLQPRSTYTQYRNPKKQDQLHNLRRTVWNVYLTPEVTNFCSRTYSHDARTYNMQPQQNRRLAFVTIYDITKECTRFYTSKAGFTTKRQTLVRD
jgi:hypothetical protein